MGWERRPGAEQLLHDGQRELHGRPGAPAGGQGSGSRPTPPLPHSLVMLMAPPARDEAVRLQLPRDGYTRVNI